MPAQIFARSAPPGASSRGTLTRNEGCGGSWAAAPNVTSFLCRTGDISTFDLHAFNHCRQRFESRLDFHESRQEFRDAHLRGKAADGATAAAWEMAAWSARGLEEQLSLLAAETRGSYPESEVEILLHERWAHEEEDW